MTKKKQVVKVTKTYVDGKLIDESPKVPSPKQDYLGFLFIGLALLCGLWGMMMWG